MRASALILFVVLALACSSATAQDYSCIGFTSCSTCVSAVLVDLECTCTTQLNDGICDEECNNFDCKYDMGDCHPPNCFCPVESLNDGICDSSCDTSSCFYDYGDCSIPNPECEWCSSASYCSDNCPTGGSDTCGSPGLPFYLIPAVVGACVGGCIFLVAVAGFIAFCVVRNRGSRTSRGVVLSNQSQPTSGVAIAAQPQPAYAYPPQQPGYPAQPGYPPQQPGYPPQQPGYAPQPGYPPQQPGYPPSPAYPSYPEQPGYPDSQKPATAPPAYSS